MIENIKEIPKYKVFFKCGKFLKSFKNVTNVAQSSQYLHLMGNFLWSLSLVFVSLWEAP